MEGRDWVRLADYVINRRTELGYDSQDALAVGADVSLKTINRLENGTAVSSTTLGKIERGLRWAPGSVRAVLAGGAPTELADPEVELDPARAALVRETFQEWSKEYGRKTAQKMIDQVIADFQAGHPNDTGEHKTG